MTRYSQVLTDARLADFLQECDAYQLSSGTGSPSDSQIADEQLASLAAYAIPELVAEVRELRAALTTPALSTTPRCGGVGEWVSVADRLPERGDQVWAVLLHYGKRQEVRRAFYRPDGYWDEFLAERITHWQPLYVPEPAAPPLACTTCTAGNTLATGEGA